MKLMHFYELNQKLGRRYFLFHMKTSLTIPTTLKVSVLNFNKVVVIFVINSFTNILLLTTS